MSDTAPFLPLELRSAADAICLSANHLRVLLGPEQPEPDEAAAIRRYGAESSAMQVWFAWKAARAFAETWSGFIAAAMPVETVRVTTMFVEAPKPAPPVAEEPECLRCQ